MARTFLRQVLDKADLLLSGKERFARRKGVTIGRDCRILSNIVTTEPWLITVGDRVTISSEVTFITHDGSGWLVRDDRGRRYRYAPITLGSDVFIGAGVTIMPGVSIGDHVVVGAGSVVTKNVPAGTVVAGVPARAVSTWDDFERKVRAWPSASDMHGTTYRERVDSIVEPPTA
ncbi:acyltransferase [Microbacterium sp. RURRCA19A]|uniref:acyltransferase n=1 Tax=Microbacterium sp. RURRCA19A TaxID=1907391 RepID=UPI0009574D6D|nr:acyltransferase [Microbacterium sp. RURRCA19A]SIR78661.1 transferase hexapeptide (six repeat-containing protein) [Microbacterium sp. RURRCA19A]